MSDDPKDKDIHMNKDMLRIAICDCHTGHFITSMTKAEVEYLYRIVTDFHIYTGQFVKDEIASGAINILGELKEYVVRKRAGGGAGGWYK